MGKLKILIKIICFATVWTLGWQWYAAYKDKNTPYAKTQDYCNQWEKEQKSLDKPMVFYIHKGEATLTLPTHRISGVPFGYTSDAYEIIDDKCMPSRIYYMLPIRDLGVENYKNLPMSFNKVFIKMEVLQLTREETVAFMEDKIRPMKDEQKYQPQIAMKHFPLWFYRDFYDKDGHGYGLMHYNNSLTNNPYVIGCDFGQPHENHDETTYQMIINAKQTRQGSIVPCGGSLYVITPQAILVAHVSLERDTVPYANEIFMKVEEQLTQFLATPEP